MSFAGINHNKPPKDTVFRLKDCYCHTCGAHYHRLGIMRHRAMHRDRGEDCRITFSTGDTFTYNFSSR